MRSSSLSLMTVVMIFANLASANSGVLSRTQTQGQGRLSDALTLPISVKAITTDFNSTFGDTVICSYTVNTTLEGVPASFNVSFANADTSTSTCDFEAGRAAIAQWQNSLTKNDLDYTYLKTTLVTYGNSGTAAEMSHCYKYVETDLVVKLEDGTTLHGTSYTSRIEIPMSVCE